MYTIIIFKWQQNSKKSFKKSYFSLMARPLEVVETLENFISTLLMPFFKPLYRPETA